MQRVKTITLTGGRDKSGAPENILLELLAGSITAIVGPTGSGKSRLLADIEWMAQNDTPTGRTVLLNGCPPDAATRFALRERPVVQLSQNMNFVMDATVAEFISLHAECRLGITPEDKREDGDGKQDIAAVTEEIIGQANRLAGEAFDADTALTALSGGQARALMIADAAFLSRSPVVLIDEIENAGIDRRKALSLLAKNEKIVLIATHDPLLALLAQQRLIIKNGAIAAVIRTSESEKQLLADLEKADMRMQTLRNQLRAGNRNLDGC
jgi:ABC-type lipoprotein export system ATPase subunit